MSQINLTDFLALTKSNVYTAPRDQNAFLPKVFGDMTENSDDVGIWTAPCIDTQNFVFCAADSATLTLGGGNVFRVFDANGTELSDYTVNTAHNFELQGIITTLTFSSDPGEITVQCKGKATSGNVLITNPVDVIREIINTSSSFENTLFNQARLACASQGYTCAGVILDEQPYQFWLTSIAACFLMDAYVNASGLIILRVDTGDNTTIFPSAFLKERDAQRLDFFQSAANLKNQFPINYAVSFESDKRFSEGARSNFRRTDDGESTKDMFSQRRYGIQKPKNGSLSFNWTRNTATVNTTQARYVELFKAPTYVYEFLDIDLQYNQVEEGEYIVFSCWDRHDSDGNPLVNQFGKVFFKGIDPNTGSLMFKFREVALSLYLAPDLWDGTATAGDGGYFGAARDTERF